MPRKTSPYELAYYEGLVCKTSIMYVDLVEEDLDDIRQLLRIKVWRALRAYSPQRSKVPVERYVFSCLRNLVKDLLKRKRLNLFYLDGLVDDGRRAQFENRYLSFVAEDFEEEITLPSTLTRTERQVVLMLYDQYKHAEIAVELSLCVGDVRRAVASVRVKMADQRPGATRELVAA